MSKKGINLIEVIVALVVLGIAIPTLLNLWQEATRKSVLTEATVDATFYAQNLLEEIKSKRFDENLSSPWSNTSTFSVGTGKDESSIATADDVDDYNGYSDYCANGVCSTAPGTYQRQVTVNYARLNGTTWEDCANPNTCGTVSDCSTCAECCYKHITVTVTRSDNLMGPISVDTLVGGF